MANQQQVRFREAVGNGVNHIALQAPAIVSADQTITLPDQTGTVVTTGDNGSVTSTMILDGTILNADINASAAIAGTKISPDFGSQTIVTTGVHSAAAGSATTPSIAFTGDLNTGIYSPGADQLAVSTGGTGRLFVDASGRVGIGTSSPGSLLNLAHATAADIRLTVGGTLQANIYSSSSDTVIFSVVNNPLIFGTNNAERARIDSNGNVGIGTSSPVHRLDVQGGNARIYAGGGGSALEIGNGAVGNQFAFIDLVGDTTYSDYGLRLIRNNTGANASSSLAHRGTGALNIAAEDAGSVTLATQNVERLRIDSSGNVGIGTSAPGYALDVAAADTTASTGYAVRIRANATAGAGALQFTDSAATAQYGLLVFGANGVGTLQAEGASSRLVFGTNATERLRIDSSGRLLFNHTDSVGLPGINNTNQGLTFENVASNGVSVFISRDTTCLYLNRNSDGTLQDLRRSGTSVGTISVTTTATAYNTSSDYRLKENVVPLVDAIDRVNDLQVHRFNFIADPSKTVDGFIAHEAQAVVPECVTGTKDAVDDDDNPIYQGIDQSKLVPLLTAALQEAIARIETLEAAVAALQGA